MKKTTLSIFLNIFTALLFSQGDTSTIDNSKSFSVRYDNDVFLKTDRYYTQGIFIELKAPFVRRSPISFLLIAIQKNASNVYSLSAKHDGFTPYTILDSNIRKGDRPYTATLIVSHTLISNNATNFNSLKTQFDIGIIGESAMGEQMQKGIHRAINNDQPLGWQYQLKDDLILNYNIRYNQNVFQHKCIAFNSVFALQLGTLYDDFTIGMEFKIGKIRSAGNSMGTEKGIRLHLHSGFETKFVAYNATLQGGFLNRNSVYSLSGDELNRLVIESQLGIVLGIKNLNIAYSIIYKSSEFEKGIDHSWGRIQFDFLF